MNVATSVFPFASAAHSRIAADTSSPLSVVKGFLSLLQEGVVPVNAEAAPIVLLLDRQADVFLAKRAGADAYLVKPFTSQQLRAALGALPAPTA